ncbi:hypothetical protein F4212_05485 [Candidatus Poribacteria bacterium]|nr:hypothetical protein [Gammaproteobacteria bacterium]MYF98575.1 hypothetical protein [Candidatus Poribacteria bacterium]
MNKLQTNENTAVTGGENDPEIIIKEAIEVRVNALESITKVHKDMLDAALFDLDSDECIELIQQLLGQLRDYRKYVLELYDGYLRIGD